MKRINAIKLAVLLFALSGGPAIASTSLPAELLEGQVLLESVRTDESGGAARARALFSAPADVVWEVILSCKAAFAYVKGMKRCEILEDSPVRGVVNQVVDRSWLVPEQDYSFESLREPHRYIRFRLLEGNLDILEGYWLLEPHPEGLLVEYEVRVKPSFPVPRFLVRHVIRHDLTDLLACIRALADGSGLPQQKNEDLSRCPGPVID